MISRVLGSFNKESKKNKLNEARLINVSNVSMRSTVLATRIGKHKEKIIRERERGGKIFVYKI